MKKIILTTCLILGLALVITGCSNNTNQATVPPDLPAHETKDGFLTHASNTHGISLDYPEGWDVEAGTGEEVVTFISPLENEADVFYENFSLQKVDMEGLPINLEAYVIAAVPTLEEEGCRVKEQIDFTLTGLPAKKIICEGGEEEIEGTWVQAYVIANGNLYIMTYVTSPDDFDKFEPQFEEIFESFRVN